MPRATNCACSAAVCVTLLLGGVAGCRSAQPSDMTLAVSAERADVRREALLRVVRSGRCGEPWAVEGLTAIALLEKDAPTRCVALRGLRRSGDGRVADVCLRILNASSAPPDGDVWPAGDDVRSEAADVLATLAASATLPADRSAEIRVTALRLLTSDTCAAVRIAAARCLAQSRDMDAVRALVAGLRDSNFAVVDACEDSLVALTGHTESAVASAWEKWLAANPDGVFAHAGEVPPTRRPPYAGAWGKMRHDARTWWEWFVPPAK